MKKPMINIPVLQGGFEPWTTEGEIYELVVRGEIPIDLRGTFFRNGPNPQHVLNERPPEEKQSFSLGFHTC